MALDNQDDIHGEEPQGTQIQGQAPMAAPADNGQPKSGIRREVGDVPPERLELVQSWTKKLRNARKYWKPDFDRIRSNQDFVLGLQWEGQTKVENEDRYVCNITQRHVNQRVASIYAKNPTVVARRKEMMDFTVWDEDPQSFQTAVQFLQATNQRIQDGAATGTESIDAIAADAGPAGQAAVQQAMALVQDVQQGMQARMMMNKISRTAELYFKNKVLTQQFPPFKASMKQLVRRVQAGGVGYMKLGLQREMEISPDTIKNIATTEEAMRTIELLMADMTDDNPDLDSLGAEKEELRIALATMHSTKNQVVQEGIVFDFPSATSIIWDTKISFLPGAIGADWGAEEYLLTHEQVEKIWGVDVGGSFSSYDPANTNMAGEVENGRWGKRPEDGDGKYKKGMICVWVIYDRTTGSVFTVADGYKDFLEEPAAPKLKLERFFPWFVLGFNLIEHHKQVYPLSDVQLMRSQQVEYNRSRQGLREHRIANRPMTAVKKGALSDDDVNALQARPANAVVQLLALGGTQKIGDVLQNWEGPAIRPELYDVKAVFEDVERSVGDQVANLGGTAGATATESSIAESSRTSSIQSNMDDLDDFLSEAMRAAGQVVFAEIGKEEITRIVGRGAVWPELSGQDIADEIFLEIQAGSSGRPNKAQEIQNMTMVMPILLQIPGLSPKWIAQQMLNRMDDRLDLTEAFMQGAPSIQAQNAQAGKPPSPPTAGPGGQDPAAQGGEGGQTVRAPTQRGGETAPQPGNAQPPAVRPVMHS